MKKKTVVKLLRDNNLRVTMPRVNIILTILSKECIFSAQDNYKNLEPLDSTNLATIYRFLALLKNKGIISEIISIYDTVYYCFKGSSDNHQHLLCEKCLDVKCTKGPAIKDRVILEELGNDFTVKEISVVIRGICSSCR